MIKLSWSGGKKIEAHLQVIKEGDCFWSTFTIIIIHFDQVTILDSRETKNGNQFFSESLCI